MKTATIQDLTDDLPSVLHWIDDGEEVSIVRQGQTFAMLVPVSVGTPVTGIHPPFVVPDFLGQMRELFGDRMLSDEDSAAIRDAMKGER